MLPRSVPLGFPESVGSQSGRIQPVRSHSRAVLASCLDGRAYILSMSRMRAIGYCAAESKGAGITCVAPAPAGERVGPDHVLVGCKDGSLHLVRGRGAVACQAGIKLSLAATAHSASRPGAWTGL